MADVTVKKSSGKKWSFISIILRFLVTVKTEICRSRLTPSLRMGLLYTSILGFSP